LDQEVDLIFDILSVFGMVKWIIKNLMTLFAKRICKSPHSQKEAHNLLDMVGYIVSFLSHFHHQISDGIVGFVKPGMILIQLITENQA
jgi:hypothetical protein